jgi:hypothetical protein
MTVVQKPTGARGRVRSLAGALLTHPCLPAFAAALALLLTLPALNNGWMLDDYYHRTVLLGTSRFRDLFGPPEEMFRFFRGDPSRTTRVMDLGFFPWWTFPGLKAEFCQVLTVPTHRLDYRLWPDSPQLMHAHSLVWLAALVAAVAWLYRQILGPTWVAGAAALLFAVDDARGACVGFLANRNALVAGFFGVLALTAHHAWRDRGRRPALVLAPLLLAASLFAKEEGMGTCAYLAAYGLWLDRSGWKRGSLALAPYLGVVLLWRTVRAQWGYGVSDMGLYVDPLTDPGRSPSQSSAACRRFSSGSGAFHRPISRPSSGRPRGPSTGGPRWSSSRPSVSSCRPCSGTTAGPGSGRQGWCSPPSLCARLSQWTGC